MKATLILAISYVFLITLSGCSGGPTKDIIVERIKNAPGDSKWDGLNGEHMACYTSVDNLIDAVGKPDSRVNTDPSGDQIWTWQCSDGAVSVTVDAIFSDQVTLRKYEMNTY